MKRSELMADIEMWAGTDRAARHKAVLEGMTKRQLRAVENLCDHARRLGVESGKATERLRLEAGQ